MDSVLVEERRCGLDPPYVDVRKTSIRHGIALSGLPVATADGLCII